jgi:predicted DNA-binding protein
MPATARTKRKNSVLLVRMDKKDLTRLKKIAKTQETTMSGLVRRAINALLEVMERNGNSMPSPSKR